MVAVITYQLHEQNISKPQIVLKTTFLGGMFPVIWISFFMITFEVIIFMRFYFHVGVFKSSKIKLVIALSVYVLMVGSLHLFNNDKVFSKLFFPPHFYSFFSIQVACWLWFYLFSYFFDLPKMKRIYFAFLLMSLRAVSEAVAIVLPLHHHTLENILDNDYGPHYMVSVAFAKILLLLMSKQFYRYNYVEVKLTTIQKSLILSVPLITTLSVYVTTAIFSFNNLLFSISTIIILMGFLLANYLSLVFYCNMGEHEQRNLILTNELLVYQSAVASGAKAGELLHDNFSKIRHMVSLCEEKDYKNLLDSLLEFRGDLKGLIENSFLPSYIGADGILREKIFEAQANGIEVTTDIFVPFGLPIDELDLCVIIGNAMNNAIQACLKTTEIKKINLIFSYGHL